MNVIVYLGYVHLLCNHAKFNVLVMQYLAFFHIPARMHIYHMSKICGWSKQMHAPCKIL